MSHISLEECDRIFVEEINNDGLYDICMWGVNSRVFDKGFPQSVEKALDSDNNYQNP